jgi:formate dehydrogenase alpha subunit
MSNAPTTVMESVAGQGARTAAAAPAPQLNVTIDGIETYVPAGTTILDAAASVGVKIPTLCYLRGINDIGSCRVCSVEVEGRAELAPACNTPVEDGMNVSTRSERATAFRRQMLDLIISEHGLNSTNYCFSCNKNGACELQAVCREEGVTEPTFPQQQVRKPVFDSNPFLSFDPNLCIKCQRCVAACNTQARNHTLQTGKKGVRTTILAPFGPNWKQTSCESCGCCAAACPTGALTEKRRADYREWEVRKVLTSCPHCATGCQLYLKMKGNRIVDVEPADGPSNHGRLCVKGRSASFDFVNAPDRLRTPLIKNHETGEFEPATWDEALSLVASKFMELKQQYGPDSLAAFACSRSTNEDIYMLQKMARTAFGTNNVDNCARVCHSPSVAGLAATLGSGAMTNPIYDITHDVDCIMLVGSNPEEAHPVVGMQIRQAVERGTKLIVVDPRDIGLSRMADIHLKLRPGTNVAFSNGMCHVMIEEGLIDEKFIQDRTEGFEDFAKMVADYTPERVAEICNIDKDDLIAAARLYATAGKAPIIYCLGVTEHSTGTEGVMSMSNIALLCGKLGRSGCGVNPLRGQNNVQGACDMGAAPADFPGYQKLTNPDVLAKFEKAWGVKLNPKKGMFATEVFHAAVEKRIRGLFIFGEDQVRTDPNISHVIEGLKALDFLVVDDLFMTETAKYADVVLPGRSYAEKEGTFTNTERRVIRVRKAVEVEGDNRPDTWIFSEIMRRMGYDQPDLTPAQIMDEIASVTPSFAGISHERLDSPEVAGNGLQWPCLGPDHPGTPIMHVGKFARGLGRFSTARYQHSTEMPDEEYPLILSTGRILYHYNATAMTARTEGINEIANSSFIEINTADAQRLGIQDGDRVTVASRRHAIHSTARVSDKTNPGETWMPFHFEDGNANWLTIDSFDSICACPEYKVCAVKVSKA